MYKLLAALCLLPFSYFDIYPRIPAAEKSENQIVCSGNFLVKVCSCVGSHSLSGNCLPGSSPDHQHLRMVCF